MKQWLFQPLDEFTAQEIGETIVDGIKRYEPRVVVKNVNIDIVSNPEFLREGAAVRDFLIPDRVVIGSNSKISLEIMKEVYRPLFLNETPQIITDLQTAETIKYASNSFLAVKISFINEIANLCDKTGADVHVVARAMGLDGRISR